MLESEFQERSPDLDLVAIDPLLVQHELHNSDSRLVTLDIVLDVSGLELHGEVVDLFPVDGLEESRLSTSVGSAHSVSVTTTKLEGRVVEEKETSVSEGERKVANDLSLFVIFLLGLELESGLRR